VPFYTQERIPTPGGMEYFSRQYAPSLSLIFSESFMEGLRDITPALAQSYGEYQYAGGEVYKTEDQWKSSEFFREGLEYDQDMTEGQARLLAERSDQNRRHEDLMSRTSLGGTALGFGGYLVGSIPDPINIIPWLGLVKKAKQVQALINATTRGKRILRGSIEAGAGAVAFHPLYKMEKGAYQEKYDLSMFLMDVSLSAGIGGAFGGLFGRIHPKDSDLLSITPDPAIPNPISHIPLEDLLDAAKVGQAQNAVGKPADVGDIYNRSKPEPETLGLDTTTAQANARLVNAPSGVLKGSFEDSKLTNPDGSLMRVYHGTVQRPDVSTQVGQFETILPGERTNGLISFTTDPEMASAYAEGFGYTNLYRAEFQAAYHILTDDFPDVFEFDLKTGRGKVLKPERLKDEDVSSVINNSEPRDKEGMPITLVEDGNTIENMVRELEDGFQELASGGVIYPRFLNVKNPYPDVMDFKDAEKLGAEWFKKEGWDAVWSTERTTYEVQAQKEVIFTVDPAQSKSIYEPEFRKLNEAVATKVVTPVSNDPLKSRKELKLEEEIANQNIKALGDRVSDENIKKDVDVDEWGKKMDLHAGAFRLAGHCVGRT
jgi:hypothetical protein